VRPIPVSSHFDLLRHNIYLSSLSSDTPSLCSSLSMTDHVSHPLHKMKNYSLFVHILIFILLDGKLEDKRSLQLSCVRCKVPNIYIVVYPRTWISPHLANGDPVSIKWWSCYHKTRRINEEYFWISCSVESSVSNHLTMMQFCLPRTIM